MLKFVVTDVDDAQHILPSPLSVTLRMEEDVPADDLYAVFPAQSCGELKNIAAYDGGRLVFAGVVDEEERLYRPSGAYLRISARSLAAHLLDNEATPCGYDHPDARLIYERHVRQYGIAAGDIDDATCFGELSVSKGTSQWGVVSAFCSACYSSTPRVSADGTLYLKGLPVQGSVTFGNIGGIRCIRCTELSDVNRRCEEISRVRVKISSSDGYGYPVENADALRRGIRRERCLNAMLSGKAVKSADMMLEKGWEKARWVSLQCPGRHIGILGSSAVIRDSVVGDRDGLYVSAVKYHMDSHGEYTAVKLRRRHASCGYQDM